jgi:hypothetical protein
VTHREWLYVGAAGLIALGGVAWFAVREHNANAAAAQASDQSTLADVQAAMAGGGGALGSYYGMSGGGSYIPEAGQVTSTQPSQPTDSSSGSSSSASDPILGFLEAYMTSNAGSQQSSLENEVSSLTSQLNSAKSQAGQVSGLQATIQQLTSQLSSVQSQYNSLNGTYQTTAAGYQDQQRAIAAYKGIFDQTVNLLHQAQTNNDVGVNKDALNQILNTPLPA